MSSPMSDWNATLSVSFRSGNLEGSSKYGVSRSVIFQKFLIHVLWKYYFEYFISFSCVLCYGIIILMRFG